MTELGVRLTTHTRPGSAGTKPGHQTEQHYAGPAVGLPVELVPDDRVLDLDEAGAEDDLRPFLRARRLRASEEVEAARRLHAEVYQARGFIGPDDIGDDGTLRADRDPWQSTAAYFGVVRDGIALVTARQIHTADPARLPTLRLDGLDPNEVRAAGELPPSAIVEISALARRPGVPVADVVSVCASMWRASMAHGHRLWLMAVDERVFSRLRATVAGDALQPIGPAQEFLGSVVLPARIRCDDLPPAQRRLADAQGATWQRLLPRLFPARPARQ